MTRRILFENVIVIMILILGCEKENNNSIPELSDSNPKVAQIKFPGMIENSIRVYYQDELIRSITRTGDSIVFFYTTGQIDSARRYYRCENGSCVNEYSVKFLKKNDNIIQANFKTTQFSNDTNRFRFIYSSDKLVALKSSFTVDTFIYNNGQISELRTYLLVSGPNIAEIYAELLKVTRVRSFINKPNPFNLISERLGFPYFSCVIDLALGEGLDFHKECIVDYEIEDNQYGSLTGKLK